MQTIEAAWQQTGPAYDRARLGCGIAHLGVGNFVRSHLAVFLHAALEARPEPWLIHGVGLRAGDAPLLDALRAQGGLYTLVERSGSHDTLRVVGALKGLTLAPPDPAAAIRLLASDSIRIISLTVTEKGYYNTSAGDLDLAHPEVRADLEGEPPQTAVGWLFRACQERAARCAQPVTLLSCDNVPHNGDLLQRLLLQFAELKDPAVASWIRDHVACPNGMVDRITPAVTDETRAFVATRFGIADAAPVVSEAYLQWVLEDRFASGRPAFEGAAAPVRLESGPAAARVQFVDDVTPYEQLKMRLLNGAHSALAYPAALMGFVFVDDALGDAALRRFVEQYMDEVTATLPPVPGLDVAAYKRTLVERFANPAVRDQVGRLAEDGSKKIRNFVVPPLEAQLASGGPIRMMAFALAAWVRYLRGLDERGQTIKVIDPMGPALATAARQPRSAAAALLALQEIFGERAAASERLLAAVLQALDTIERLGTRQAMRML